MTGKIEQARQALEDVKQERDAIKAEGLRLRRDAIRLDASSDPDDITRAAARRKLSDRKMHRVRGSDSAQSYYDVKIDQAQKRLDRTRETRYNLERSIERMTHQADLLGDVDELIAISTTLANRIKDVTGLSQKRKDVLRLLAGWLYNERTKVLALDARRARLAEFGPDPDYRPARRDERGDAHDAALARHAFA